MRANSIFKTFNFLLTVTACLLGATAHANGGKAPPHGNHGSVKVNTFIDRSLEPERQSLPDSATYYAHDKSDDCGAYHPRDVVPGDYWRANEKHVDGHAAKSLSIEPCRSMLGMDYVSIKSTASRFKDGNDSSEITFYFTNKNDQRPNLMRINKAVKVVNIKISCSFERDEVDYSYLDCRIKSASDNLGNRLSSIEASGSGQFTSMSFLVEDFDSEVELNLYVSKK